MATVAIPQLPQATSLTGLENLEVVQAGASARVTAAQLAQLAANPTVITGAIYATQAPFYADNTGATDATAAIAAFLASPAGSNLVMPAGTYLTSNPELLASNGTTLWCFGTIQATPTFAAVGGNNFILRISGNNCKVWTPVVDGAVSGNVNVADGISVTGDGSVVYFPQATHCPNACLQLTGTDSAVYEPFMTQWNSGDFQFNPNNGSFYTADAIQLNGSDNLIVGGVARWSNICLHAVAGAGTNNVIGLHMYNGTAAVGVARVDSTTLQVDAGVSNNIWLTSPYFDNGHIKIFNGGISIRDGYALTNGGSSFTNDSDGNQNFCQIYANGNIQPFADDFTWRNVTLNSGQKLKAYLPYLANTWTGDYTGIPQVLTNHSQALRGNAGEVFVQTEEQAYGSGGLPAQAFYKAGNLITIVYQIGATTTPTVINVGNMTISYVVNSLQILGTTTSSLLLGTESSVYDDGFNNLLMQTVSTDRWMVVSNGNFRPAADLTYNIGNVGGGSGSHRINEIFLGASGGAGTPCVSIDDSATTGAQTATFTATNKPGTGTTAPAKWIPVELDGTTYYVPAWT